MFNKSTWLKMICLNALNSLIFYILTNAPNLLEILIINCYLTFNLNSDFYFFHFRFDAGSPDSITHREQDFGYEVIEQVKSHFCSFRQKVESF